MSQTSVLRMPSQADEEQLEIARGCEAGLIDALKSIGTEVELTMDHFEQELRETVVARCSRAGFSAESTMIRLDELFTELRPLVLKGKVSSAKCKTALRPIISLLLEARLRLLAMPLPESVEEDHPIIHTSMEWKNESVVDYKRQYPKYRFLE